MLRPVKNEPIIDDNGSRWEYVYDTVKRRHYYLHLNCDCTTDEKGYCYMCKAPCPTIWTMISR